MSDNVANVDFNDVLSSIRRLVRDEVAEDERAPVLNDEDKLVLSPSLRVVPTLADSTASEAPAFVSAGPTDVASALERTIAQLETVVGGNDGYEPESGQEDDLEENAPAFFRSAVAARARVEAGEESGPGADLNLSFIPDPGETPAPDAGATPEPLKLSPEDIVTMPGPDRAVSDGDTATQSGADDADEVILDEETLRQIVRNTVREELQGALGEAITRNIRKLIRREINAYFDGADRI